MIRKVQMLNAFKISEKEVVSVKLAPKGGKPEDEETEMVFKGTETLTQAEWNIASLWRWDSSELVLEEGPLGPLLNHGPALASYGVKSTGMLRLLVETTVAREQARKEDILEAQLESIRSLMLCQRTELHLHGCISLWRIAVQRSQHKGIGDSVFTLLIKVLRSDDPHVAVIGAAAVWMLAEQDATLRRLPVGHLVKALLHTYPVDGHEEEKGLAAFADPDDAPPPAEEGAEAGEAEAAEAAEAEAEGGSEEDDADSEYSDEEERAFAMEERAKALVAAKEAREAHRRNSDIVYAATGKRLKDLRHLPIRALQSLMKMEDGRRAFHRCMGSQRLLPLLCDDNDDISSAVAALFSRATGTS